MAPSVLPVLPNILTHLSPSPSHIFYVPSRGDYLEIRESYRTLASCALVCSSWCWTAQVALFRCAIIARPNIIELDRSLSVYDGGVANATTFLRTLKERRVLGPVVRSLCLFYSKWFAEIVRDILASCPNVSVLVLASSEADKPSDSLITFGQHPSVRVFGHKSHARDDNMISSIGRCFPGVEELQLPFVHLSGADAPFTGTFRDLRNLHIRTAGAEINNLAALDIRVLRIHSLCGFRHTIVPFRCTLRTLDVWKLVESADPLDTDNMDGLEDFLELRVLKVHHDRHPLFPRALPPKLETLTINFDVLRRYPERVRSALEHHASVRLVTVLHDNRDVLTASAKIEQVLGGLSLVYRRL